MMVGYIDCVFGAGRKLGLGGEAGPGAGSKASASFR
jgi:hypothetical protein